MLLRNARQNQADFQSVGVPVVVMKFDIIKVNQVVYAKLFPSFNVSITPWCRNNVWLVLLHS